MIIYENGMESSRSNEILFSVQFSEKDEDFSMNFYDDEFFCVISYLCSLSHISCQRFVGQLFLCEEVPCLLETSQEFQKDSQFYLYFYYICFPSMIVYHFLND